MQVDQILHAKGRKVHTISADAPLSSAVDLLSRHGIGALVALGESGAVVGILSERDIVRRLSRGPADLQEETVASCMTRNLVTTTRAASIGSLMEIMTHHRIRHIPVIDDGELAGLVSIGDVVKLKIAETEREAEALRSYIVS